MYSKNNKPQVSDKDTPCLKLLEVVTDANGQKVYLTPYTGMRITPDMLSGKTFIEPKYDSGTVNEIYRENENYLIVREGFIHTFDYDILITDLVSNIKVFEWVVTEGEERTLCDDVVKQLGYPLYTYPNILNVTLCECVIPAGTPFVRGSECINPYIEEYYASGAIRVTKILHEFTKEDFMEKDISKIVKHIIENNKI